MENNNEQKTEDTMQLSVLEKIRTDKVSMRSRSHFYVRIGFALFLIALILGISIFLCNFILFTVAASGRSLLLQFGSRGFLFFLQFFPWWLFALDIILILVLEQILRQFKFAYRFPSLYILIAMMLVIAAAGFSLEHADTKHRFVPGADEQGRMHEGAFLSGVRKAPPVAQGVCRCTVIAVYESGLSVVENVPGTVVPFAVVLPEDNPRVRAEGLVPGDHIFVAGDIRDGVLYAFGLHKAAPGEPAFR